MDGLNIERMVDADSEWALFPYHIMTRVCKKRGYIVTKDVSYKHVANSNGVWINMHTPLYKYITEYLDAAFTKPQVKTCECGVDKVGAGIHSSWCPKA